MKFIKEWHEKETNKWVLQFEFEEEEYAQLQKIEAEVGMSFSDMVNAWFKWLIQNPEKAKEQIDKWSKEKEGEEQNENYKKCDQV